MRIISLTFIKVGRMAHLGGEVVNAELVADVTNGEERAEVRIKDLGLGNAAVRASYEGKLGSRRSLRLVAKAVAWRELTCGVCPSATVASTFPGSATWSPANLAFPSSSC